jgi:hypothetical protein
MKPILSLLLTIIIASNVAAQIDEKIYELDFDKIDSVTLVEYTAIIRYNQEPKLKSYQPDMDSLERQKIDVENENKKKKYEDFLNYWFPNRVAGRDMSIPPETITILNKKGEFYPNTRWETYRTFPTDSVMQLLKILNCSEAFSRYRMVYDTIHPVDSTEMPIIKSRYVKATLRIATCGPHLNLGIILWHKGEVLQIISTGYSDLSVFVGYLEDGQLENQDCVVINEMRKELRRLGYFRDGW